MAARALTLCLAASLCAARSGEITPENNSEKLAKSLRRKLVQNNYDYMSDESQEDPQPRSHYRKQSHKYDIPQNNEPLSDKIYKNTYYEKYRQTINFQSSKKRIIKNKDNIDLKNKGTMINFRTQSIDEDLKDIVQGKDIKINRIISGRMFEGEISEKNRHTPKYKSEISYEDNSFTDTQQLYSNNNHDSLTTTAQYKILKIKKTYRRSGSPSTLIQEETPESVSIVNMGGGPIPDFRLPRGRRQYMHLPANIGTIDEDDELPPPPVNETNIATEDTEPKESYKPLDIHVLHANDNSDKEAQNMTLMITVTPDEIFVL